MILFTFEGKFQRIVTGKGKFLKCFPRYPDNLSPKEGELSKISKFNDKQNFWKTSEIFCTMVSSALSNRLNLPYLFFFLLPPLPPLVSTLFCPEAEPPDFFQKFNGYYLNCKVFLSSQTLPKTNNSPPSCLILKHLTSFSHTSSLILPRTLSKAEPDYRLTFSGMFHCFRVSQL